LQIRLYLWFDIENVEQRKEGFVGVGAILRSRIANPLYLWFDIGNVEQRIMPFKIDMPKIHKTETVLQRF
jgi:hypothetical protein